MADRPVGKASSTLPHRHAGAWPHRRQGKTGISRLRAPRRKAKRRFCHSLLNWIYLDTTGIPSEASAKIRACSET